MIGEKKDDDDAGSNTAVKVLDKSAVLQEVRAFNDPQIDARRCVELIGSLLRLISRGDVLTANECQDVFFGSTKLFQCPDERLRRMVYLLIKELRPSADIVFIVTASLNKDMTGSNDNFRSNALRVMCQITDAQMLLQVERFIKQACVDKHAAVSSAALVSGLQLLKKSNDSVKRWQNEVMHILALLSLTLLLRHFDAHCVTPQIFATSAPDAASVPVVLIAYPMIYDCMWTVGPISDVIIRSARHFQTAGAP
jgi:hypothetical protein